jgi:uncharacterized membrane protein
MTLQATSGTTRIQSVDIIRGAVMVLMAIDHVRVYSGVPPGGPDPAVFFTRWVTHFCAPAFVFFAGTSALLYGRKLNDLTVLRKYLFTRGLLLVLLELTLIRFGWSFNFNYSEFTLAGVIWMIGWCMILLSLMIRLSPALVGYIGLSIIFLQQIFAFVPRGIPTISGFWEFIYSAGNEALFGVNVLYVLVPWIGVMMAGYGFGSILLLEPAKRNNLCLKIGLSAIALYLVVGVLMILIREPKPDAPPFIFQLLNQQKYPASQLFLLMTIGPAIALIPLAERAKGWLVNALTVFGRVPFFYYLLHIPLIHITALLVNVIMYGSAHQEWYATAPYAHVPEEFRWTLPLLYLIFVIDVAILYAASRWYVNYKFNHPDNALLKYI